MFKPSQLIGRILPTSTVPPVPVSFAATNVETITLRSDHGVEELMQNRSVLSEGHEVCFKMIPTLNTSICPQKKSVRPTSAGFQPVEVFWTPSRRTCRKWSLAFTEKLPWYMANERLQSQIIKVDVFLVVRGWNHRFWRVYLLEVFQTNSWQFCRFRLSVTTQQHGEALHAPWVEAQVFTAQKGEPEIGKPSTWQTRANKN